MHSGGGSVGPVPSGSVHTPQVTNNENVNAQQTPSAVRSAARHRGFVTPGKNSNLSTPHRAVPGRRDLGAGMLHFWNAQHTPGGSGGTRTGTDSVMTAADVRTPHLLCLLAAPGSRLAPCVWQSALRADRGGFLYRTPTTTGRSQWFGARTST